MIFLIFEEKDLENAKQKGEYTAPSLLTEGFIHGSTETQVIGVANRKFKGRANLVLVEVDESRVKSEIKYEGKSEKYPHIYGPLNYDAIVRTFPFLPQKDGTFDLSIISNAPGG